MNKSRLFFFTTIAVLLLTPHPAPAAEPGDAALAQRALENLRAVVAHDKDLPRLHAAEDLAILGEPDPLAPIAGEVPTLTTQPIFRIVLWRVRARLAAAAGKSIAPWTRPVVAVFFTTPDTPDRVNAAETLGKLGYVAAPEEKAGFERAAQAGGALACEARWVLADDGSEASEAALADLLKSGDAKVRGDAAYSLRFLPRLRPATHARLLATAQSEPAGSEARSYLYAAALVHATAAERPAIVRVVQDYAEKGSADDRFEAMNALAVAGDREDLGRLAVYLRPVDPFDDTNADYRVGAGNAVLHILRRAP